MTQLNSPEWINANRNGQITPQQRKAAGIAGSFVIGLVMMSFGAVGGGLFLFGGLAVLSEGDWSGLIMGAFGAVMLGGLGLFALWRLAGAWLTQLDFSEGRIEQAQGEVRWSRTRYIADVPGRSRWTSGAVIGLLPGSYQFYYLSRSGRLLSAAALPGLTGQANQSLNAVLAQVHGIGEEDLEPNRHGRMSPRQKRRLMWGALGLAAFGVAALAFGIFGVWAIFDEGSSVGGWIVTAMGFFIALLITRAIWQVAADAAKGSVKQVKGTLRVSVRSNGKSTSYYYHVGRETFSVSFTAYKAALAGKSYRLYYAPRSRRVLGLETWDNPAVNA